MAARPVRGRATAPHRRRAPAGPLLPLERGGDLRAAAMAPPRLSGTGRAGDGRMNYFKRLADRSGPSVSPRGAVTPMARPAAISPGDQLEAGDQPPPPETSLAETAAFDAPATIVLAAPGPPSAIGPAAAAPTL